MEKLIREHRRQLGDFELVEFADEREIARLRAQTDVRVPVELHWTWNYGSELEELRSLYEKGKLAQWNAELDLDWEAPCSRDEWIVAPEASVLAQATRARGASEATQRAAAFDEIAYLLSQLLHGEQAALQLCGQLTNVCTRMDEKWYAASQVADEARHVEVFSKLLERKLGGIHPIGPTLKVLLDRLLAAETAREKTFGMQTLFEGMAVGIMDLLRQQCRNPLLADVLRRVEQDESRHAAFGVLTMRRAVRDAAPEEMHAMEDWAFALLEALNANQQLDMLNELGPRYGVEPEAVVRSALELPCFAELNSLAFMHTVVPNLRRLGLISGRTREGWLRLGMMTERGEDSAP